MGSLVFQFFEESLFVSWRIKLHDLERIECVDFVDVLLQFISGLGLYLLDFLESSLLDERFLSSWVVRQGFSKLM